MKKFKLATIFVLISGFAFYACGGGGSSTNPGSSAKTITAFDFESPAATGMIYETSHLIIVTVPYATNVASLTPAITITGVRLSPAPELAQDFSDDVIYTVTAEDGSSQNYTVKVNVANDIAMDITGFSFSAANNSALSHDCKGIISTSAITVIVPYGTDVTNLTPAITISGTGISPLAGVAKNFTNPVAYTIKNANYTNTNNASDTKVYTVKVIAVSASDKIIDSFTFDNPAATGIIDETNHTITVSVPHGTDVDKLSPSINFTGKGISPASGTGQDFGNPVWSIWLRHRTALRKAIR